MVPGDRAVGSDYNRVMRSQKLIVRRHGPLVLRWSLDSSRRLSLAGLDATRNGLQNGPHNFVVFLRRNLYLIRYYLAILRVVLNCLEKIEYQLWWIP